MLRHFSTLSPSVTFLSDKFNNYIANGSSNFAKVIIAAFFVFISNIYVCLLTKSEIWLREGRCKFFGIKAIGVIFLVISTYNSAKI